MHLLSVVFHVTFVFTLFFVGNAMGAAIQITWVYNSGVKWLKKEDWPRMQPAFTCDLWKSAMNK